MEERAQLGIGLAGFREAFPEPDGFIRVFFSKVLLLFWKERAPSRCAPGLESWIRRIRRRRLTGRGVSTGRPRLARGLAEGSDLEVHQPLVAPAELSLHAKPEPCRRSRCHGLRDFCTVASPSCRSAVTISWRSRCVAALPTLQLGLSPSRPRYPAECPRFPAAFQKALRRSATVSSKS